MPPRSMNAPYSVRFLTMPSTVWPFGELLERLLFQLCALVLFEENATRQHNVAALFVELDDLELELLANEESRLRTGRRSTCEPGRNAFTPPRMPTARPPFTRCEITPSISSSRSHAAEISSHTLDDLLSPSREHTDRSRFRGSRVDVDLVAL